MIPTLGAPIRRRVLTLISKVEDKDFGTEFSRRHIDWDVEIERVTGIDRVLYRERTNDRHCDRRLSFEFPVHVEQRPRDGVWFPV